MKRLAIFIVMCLTVLALSSCGHKTDIVPPDAKTHITF
ncbi:LPS translocon maturation chaperone LptM [Hippea sp. KM1]